MNVKNMFLIPGAPVKIFVMGALTVFALAAGPTAKAEYRGCSEATLRGTFADTDTGFLTTPPAMAGPFGGVSLETFDGNGGMTTTGFVSLNGNIVPGTSKGTYTVNHDCTGTYTVQNSLGLTVHGFFVIADNGNGLRMIVTDPGTVITCIARRVFPEHDRER